MVKWTGKFVVLVLTLSVWASPLMACMLPDAMLTLEERECCQTMAGQCGDMDMPTSHSCCTPTVRENAPYLIGTRFAAPVSQAVAALQVTGAAIFTDSVSHVYNWDSTHSPPLSPPETISILRI